MRLTASRCPKSTFQPRMYIYRSYRLLVPLINGFSEAHTPCKRISSCGTHWDCHLCMLKLFNLVVSSPCLPLNFCLQKGQRKFPAPQCQTPTNLIFASSLLILFSSSSLALAFLRSAMNCTSPVHLLAVILLHPVHLHLHLQSPVTLTVHFTHLSY